MPRVVVSSPADLPSESCDICGMRVEEGERVAITPSRHGDTIVEHTACVAHWFRSNFGAEGLS